MVKLNSKNSVIKASPQVGNTIEREIADEVNLAIARKEIFEIVNFPPMFDFPLLCQALEARGWIQKLSPADVTKRQSDRNFAEVKFTADLLRNKNPNFIWSSEDFKRSEHKDHPYYNRLIARSADNNFTLKTGLAMIYQRIHWFDFSQEQEYILPRCYQLHDAAEREAFTEDYRLTLCLTFLYELSKRNDFDNIFSTSGTHSTGCIDFALDQVQWAIDRKEHKDIDKKLATFSNRKVFQFYQNVYQKILKNGEKILVKDTTVIGKYVSKILFIVIDAKKHFPGMQYDGYCNMWIVKPADWDCGNGIKLFTDGQKVLDYAEVQGNTTSWVVQKYVERPLLIYKTKFDLRQYFLITMDGEQLNIWIYKNNYCRFCGHEFTLNKLDECYHLTNHAVQQRQPNGARHPNLPAYNAWTLNNLLYYLNSIGQMNMWRTRIYPGMVKCLKTIVHATMDDMEYAANNYQLFGADFMITEDFYPVLIEINPGPYLTLTNPATAVVNTNIVHDLLKVVLDYPKDNKCFTGDFELVWKASKSPDYLNFEQSFLVGPMKTPVNTNLEESNDKSKSELAKQLSAASTTSSNAQPRKVLAPIKSSSQSLLAQALTNNNSLTLNGKLAASPRVRALSQAPAIPRTSNTSIQSNRRSLSNSNRSSTSSGVNILSNPNWSSREYAVNRFENLRKFAIQAAKEHKIFSIVGNFPELRKALISRGWVQKLYPNQHTEISKMNTSSLMHQSEKNNKYEIVLMSNYVKDTRPDFVWCFKYFSKELFSDYPYYNMLSARDRTFDFTQKDGLVNIYNQFYWFDLNTGSDFIFPRCYLLKDDYDWRAFKEDFRLTFCTGFLIYLSQLPNLEGLFCSEGSFSSEYVDLAMEVVQQAIDKRNHCDIELKYKELPYNNEMYSSFAEIVKNYYRSSDKKIRIKGVKSSTLYYLDIKALIKDALSNFPEMARDGYRNIWIVKPIGIDCGCGYGITCMNDENEIVRYVKAKGLHVVQKYIERPMLIYNTKFDIRLYFLITMNEKFMSVWMYKNCYLKFSSQEFNLDNLAQSIHVTNHTVQKKYKNGARNPLLPAHNMWVLQEFKNYLSTIGKPFLWDSTIYPGIKKSILTVFNASLESIPLARNNFQIFGADFMITEDRVPILIEVNQFPDLRPSTASTAVVCTAVVHDMVKVVVDYNKNHRSNTGDFELIWKSNMFNERTVTNMEIVGKVLSAAKPQPAAAPSAATTAAPPKGPTSNLDMYLFKMVSQKSSKSNDLSRKILSTSFLPGNNAPSRDALMKNAQNRFMASSLLSSSAKSLGRTLAGQSSSNFPTKSATPKFSAKVALQKALLPFKANKYGKDIKKKSSSAEIKLQNVLHSHNKSYRNKIPLSRPAATPHRKSNESISKYLHRGAGSTSGATSRRSAANEKNRGHIIYNVLRNGKVNQQSVSFGNLQASPVSTKRVKKLVK